MTKNAADAAQRPLLTEQDKIDRIRDLLSPASNPSQLWILILDAEGFQSPVIIPLDERPSFPDPALLDSLMAALALAFGPDVDEDRALPGPSENRTDGGMQAMFVLERLGPFGTTMDDHCWAAALEGACQRAGVRHAGTFLLSRGGVCAVER